MKEELIVVCELCGLWNTVSVVAAWINPFWCPETEVNREHLVTPSVPTISAQSKQHISE